MVILKSQLKSQFAISYMGYILFLTIMLFFILFDFSPLRLFFFFLTLQWLTNGRTISMKFKGLSRLLYLLKIKYKM